MRCSGPRQTNCCGFAMQSLFIGLGAVVGSALPWLLANVFHVAQVGGLHTIPTTMRLSFYIGAGAFLGAVLWTVITTKEYPPDNMEEFRAALRSSTGRSSAYDNREPLNNTVSGGCTCELA